MNDLLKRIDAIVRSKRPVGRDQRILIAVSGGVDSMVLLHVLHGLAAINKWRLMAAHLNHGLRGRSSDADERLVRSVCEKLGIPVIVERADVRKLSKELRLSIEMAARTARHAFLSRVAAKKRISTVALAHHADDQVELFLIRLLRGSGGEGLGGMKWRRPFPAAKGVEIVRPLLGEPKSALREYADSNRIKYREDATNESLDILRNRIRHELLPLLRRNYQPAFNKVVLRTMEIVGEEADLAKSVAEDWLWRARLPRGKALPFEKLPLAVQRRCLQIQLLAEGVSPDFELVEKLRSKPGEGVTVDKPGASVLSLCRELNGFLRWRVSEPVKFESESRKVSLNGFSGHTKFAGIDIAWQNQRKAGINLPKHKPGREYFDADLVGATATLRHWQKGDRFWPIGMSRAVKLQDIFVNQKIPQEIRHRLMLAEAEDGEIFWVEGLRISERFQLTIATKRRLQWRWKRD